MAEPRTARQLTKGRGEAAYEKLRGDILAGRLEPGRKLPFAELVSRYESSIGVIREALQRLVEQGLVESEAKHGFRVVRVSVSDLKELTDARCEIECLALRYAVAEADVRWEARIVSTHHLLERTPPFAADDPDRLSEAWAEVHRDFHQSLLEGCTNRRILAVATAWRDSAELYRRWSPPIGHDQMRDLAGEHKDILTACLARDGNVASDKLNSHIRRTTEKLITGLREDG